MPSSSGGFVSRVVRIHTIATRLHSRSQRAEAVATSVGVIIAGAAAIIGGIVALLAPYAPVPEPSQAPGNTSE